eukprot:4259563-Alexandrium_andersonii.AAC.1
MLCGPKGSGSSPVRACTDALSPRERACKLVVERAGAQMPRRRRAPGPGANAPRRRQAHALPQKP